MATRFPAPRIHMVLHQRPALHLERGLAPADRAKKSPYRALKMLHSESKQPGYHSEPEEERSQNMNSRPNLDDRHSADLAIHNCAIPTPAEHRLRIWLMFI